MQYTTNLGLRKPEDVDLGSNDDLNYNADVIDTRVGTLETEVGTLETEVGTLETEMDTLFQSVSSGKLLVATAITDKGVITNGSDTFNTMAINIGLISTGKKFASGSVVASASSLSFTYAGTTTTYSDAYAMVSGLDFTPSFFIAMDTTNKQMITYVSATDGYYAKTMKYIRYSGTTSTVVRNIKADINGAYVDSSGFRFPSSYYNATFSWFAFE